MAPFGASRAGLMSTRVDAIPDSEIYLQDDWGDNKLTDREGSATTTYNGVEGVYRPEWTTLRGSASVSDGSLSFDSDTSTLVANINLNLDSEIRWWFKFDDQGGRNVFGLFSETDSTTSSDSWDSVEDSYVLANSNSDGLCRLVKPASGGSGTDVINADGNEISSGYIGAIRESSGGFELFVTSGDLDNPDTELFDSGNSVGTGSDTEHSNPQYIPLSQTADTNSEIHQIKVF